MAKARKKMEERKKRLQENENIPPLVENPIPVAKPAENRESVKLKESVKLPAISTDTSVIMKSQQNLEMRGTVELKPSSSIRVERTDTNISRDFKREIIDANRRTVSAHKRSAHKRAKGTDNKF